MTIGRKNFVGKIPLIAALLLTGYFALAVSASRDEGPTFDEVMHVASGYNMWVNHDFRFDPANGDFAKRWATLPLLFSKINFPPHSDPDWRNAEFFSVGYDLFFNRGNNPADLLLRCRSMIAVLGVALGALVFFCSRRLFGELGGLVSLGLFVFCPHMLAFGALVSTDIAFALALLSSTWFIWRLLHTVTWPVLAGSLVSFSILLVSKMSAVVIIPIALVLIVVRSFHREPWLWRLGKIHLATSRLQQASMLAALILAHALAGWGTIWAMYDFRELARADAADTSLTFARLSDNATPARGFVAEILEISRRHHLFPEGYLKGMEDLVSISERRPSFANGHWKAGGHPWFFPYAAWVKTPPALFLLLPLGLAGLWLGRGREIIPGAFPALATRRTLYAAVPFIAVFAIYAAVAMRQNVNIGHRHILPLYAVFYIFCGSVAAWWPLPQRWAKFAVVLLLGWFTADSFAIRPHYLAYFNFFAGGPAQGYRRLVDSSLDWGQDLPGLKRWLASHNPGDRESVFLSYFGAGSPDFYGIASRRLPGFPEWRDLRVFACTPGYYAISATMFQNVYTQAFGPWNRRYEEDYQAALRNLSLSEDTLSDDATLAALPQKFPKQFWQEQYSRFEKLRFNRLCGWLRATQRRPADNVGYSILIWKLDAHDLHAALWEPPLELYDSPAVQAPGEIPRAVSKNLSP